MVRTISMAMAIVLAVSDLSCEASLSEKLRLLELIRLAGKLLQVKSLSPPESGLKFHHDPKLL